MASQDCVHFYDLHIWLNPFGLQRMVMFTPLSPTKITLRMRELRIEDHSRIRSREYREFDGAVSRFFDEAPRMTTTEREEVLAKLLAWTPSRRRGSSPARGTASPSGLDLQLYYPDSRRLEVRYEERPGGTVLHLKLATPVSAMWSWQWLFMVPYLTYLFVPDLFDGRTRTFSRSILIESLFYLGGAFLLALYISYLIINRWRRRNDLFGYRDFLVETLEAREIGTRR